MIISLFYVLESEEVKERYYEKLKKILQEKKTHK